MKFRRKTWLAAVGLAAITATTVGGVALAVEDPSTWYTGGNATVADPNKSAVALKLYNASGVQVTTGTLTQPLAAYAAADGDVRAGDQFGTLFVHLPESSTAPGAWPGVQATGTDQFSGAGAIGGIPAPLAGKPLVRTNQSGDYTLANVIAGLPNSDTAASYTGVYELRLRTSSATKGVADAYAAAYIKVTGSTWAVSDGPQLGDTGTPTAVNTSVAATWPSTATYGSPASVAVTVSAASGSAKPSGTVRLVSGATTLATGTLSAAGTATLAVPASALQPGSQSLKVTYAGVANAFKPSESSPKTLTVAKAAASSVTYKTTKAPTSKKKGAGTVTVAVPGGLAAAGGTAQVVLTKGKATKTITVTLANGTATVKLPKLLPGKWTVTISYQGDSHYLTATSKAVKLKVKKAKPKK